MKFKIIFSLIFLGVFILGSCQKDTIKKVQILTSQKVYASEIAKNVEFFYSDSAKVRIRLVSPLMETYPNYVEMTKGVEVTFYDDNGSPKGYMRSNYAIRYPAKRMMQAKNDVVVVNVKGDTLNTEMLSWDELHARFYSNNFVRVKTKTEIINSEGLVSDETFSHYTFKNVVGRIKLHSTELK